MDDRGERDRRDDPAAGQEGLLKADGGSAPPTTRRLGGRRERETVPREPERPRDGERRDEQPERRMDEQRGCSGGDRECERQLPERDDPCTNPVGPPADDDPRSAAEHLRAGEHPRRCRGRDAAVVVQEPLWEGPSAPAVDLPGVHDLDAVAAVVHTSGTASAPRAVQLTYGNLLWSAFGSAASPVRSTCGPSHRSRNSPCRYSETFASTMPSISSTLKG